MATLMTATYQHDTATICDGEFKYPCVVDPTHRWNGWACPFFTQETFIQIAKDLKQKIDSESFVLVPLDPDGDGRYGSEDYPTSYFIKTLRIDGKDGAYYYVDGWTWELESDAQRDAREVEEPLGAITRAELDSKGCSDPSCTHENDDVLYLQSRCHDAPTNARYEKRQGHLVLSCAACGLIVARIQL
jgi:hypothetical protein